MLSRDSILATYRHTVSNFGCDRARRDRIAATGLRIVARAATWNTDENVAMLPQLRLDRHPSARRPSARSAQTLPPGTAGGRRLACGDFLGRSRGHDAAAAAAALRARDRYVVGRLDHVEVVLDDDHRVALIDELVQHVEQLARVLEVQAGRRLVEDVERAARCRASTAPSPASPAAPRRRQRRRRLPELDVAEADLLQRAQLVRRSAGSSRAAAAPDRPSDRARRRSTCRGTGSRASRGCSGGPCTARTSRRRRAGSASRWRSRRRPGRPRSVRP